MTAHDGSPQATAARLRLALEMFDDAVAMLRLRLRRDRPEAPDAEIDAAVERWILTRPGAEDGDYAEAAPVSSE